MAVVLVGRLAECGRLEQLLEATRGGRSGTLVLDGEAGIGKSILLEYAATAAQGFKVLRATGVQSEEEVAFGTLLPLCRPLLTQLHQLLPSQASAVRSALGLAAATAAERFLVGAGLLGLLAAAAAQQPLLVLVDDLQWVDPPSAQALLFAARRLQVEAVAVIVAARSSETLPVRIDGLPRLTVVGLDHGEARSLVASHAPDTVDSVADRLHAATGGNPLALTELVNLLTPLQRSGRDVLPEPLPTVAALESTYAGRIASLSAATQRSLITAAAAGDADLAVIGPALARLGAKVDDLGPAVDTGLLSIGDGKVQWRHPLVRSAVYYGASEADRRAAHLALAAGRPRGSAAWARHRAAAAAGPDEEVAVALDRAASESGSRTGFASAAAAYEHAARLSLQPREAARRLLAAADAAWLAGDSARAARLLDEALSGCVDPDLRGQMLYLRGYTEYSAGDVGRSAQWLLEAADLLEGTNPELAAQSLADAALANWWSGDSPGMLAAAERLGALAAAHPDAAPDADFCSGQALIFSGQSAQGAPLLERALATYRAHGTRSDDPRSIWAVIAPGWLGRPREGRALANERVRDLRQRGALGMLPRLLRIMASTDLDDDRWSHAEAEATEALELGVELGQAGQGAEPLAILASIEAFRGDEAACRHHAGAALAAAEEHGQAWARPLALRALGLLALGQGDLPIAADLFGQVVEIPLTRGLRGAPLISLPDLVEVLVRLRRPGEASARVAEFERRIVGIPDARAPALLARCRALVESGDRAGPIYEEALEGHSEEPDAFVVARTRLLYGEWLRRRGERRLARVQLQGARIVFEAYGARPWMDRVRGELLASGATLRAPLVADAELTPSELRVAVLAADGHSNHEISAQLYLSPKTVEFHLGRVYAKLGVRSRTQLARRLPGRGVSSTQQGVALGWK